MFRLTREIRFAIHPEVSAQGADPAHSVNSHAGSPALLGLGFFFTLQLTLAGPLDPKSGYLIDIKAIDHQVRKDGVPLVEAYLRRGRFAGGSELTLRLFEHFQQIWPGLARVRLGLSPFFSMSVTQGEAPMVRLNQKFEFSAAHRLHNPALSDEQNLATYGKCNNPRGHGHNYEIQVSLRGKPDANGQIIPVHTLQQIVTENAVHKLDHKYLNEEVEEFAKLIPTVENIAMVIFHWLKPNFAAAKNGADLLAVTVWETPKTWCEYTE